MYYSEGPDEVALTMTRDQYALLLTAMGYATGYARSINDRAMFLDFVKLMNSVNSGNPNYTPFEVPEA